MSETTPGCGSNSEARKRLAEATTDDRDDRKEHEHEWVRKQNVTSPGFALAPYEVCVCGAARQVADIGSDVVTADHAREVEALRAKHAALVARVEALADEWERTANECERLSHIRAGLSDERGLSTAGMVNRQRAANLRAALTADDTDTLGGGEG